MKTFKLYLLAVLLVCGPIYAAFYSFATAHDANGWSMLGFLFVSGIFGFRSCIAGNTRNGFRDYDIPSM